jgi:hypothetical protein
LDTSSRAQSGSAIRERCSCRQMDHAPQGAEGLLYVLYVAWPPGGRFFFQKLKHRARECASALLYCSVTAYLHQRTDVLPRIILAWEAFPDRELTNFPNAGGARKGIQCCVLLFSQFANTRVLCFLILFAEDVDPDKVLRRYQWSKSGGQGLCERCPSAFKCSLGLACEVRGYANFSPCNFLFRRNSK